MERQPNQRPVHSMSRSQEQLDKLMRTAARRQEPLVSPCPSLSFCELLNDTSSLLLLCPVLQPRRTASVRSLHSALRTPQGQAAGQAMLPTLWPTALQLLQDSQADMRQAVAPVVGFLGALAARPGRPAGKMLRWVALRCKSWYCGCHWLAVSALFAFQIFVGNMQC